MKRRIQDILIVTFFAIPASFILILSLIYASPTNPIVNYLMERKALNNQVNMGCLYYSSTYKKEGYIGYYFKINGVRIKDLNLTLPNFPFAKKEVQFINEFHQNFKQRKQYCYYVQYIQIDLFFQRYVFIYDLI